MPANVATGGSPVAAPGTRVVPHVASTNQSASVQAFFEAVSNDVPQQASRLLPRVATGGPPVAAPGTGVVPHVARTHQSAYFRADFRRHIQRCAATGGPPVATVRRPDQLIGACASRFSPPHPTMCCNRRAACCYGLSTDRFHCPEKTNWAIDLRDRGVVSRSRSGSVGAE